MKYTDVVRSLLWTGPTLALAEKNPFPMDRRIFRSVSGHAYMADFQGTDEYLPAKITCSAIHGVYFPNPDGTHGFQPRVAAADLVDSGNARNPRSKWYLQIYTTMPDEKIIDHLVDRWSNHGIALHAITERMHNNIQPSEAELAQHGRVIAQIQRWLKEVKPRIIRTEVMLCSRNSLCGMVDAVALAAVDASPFLAVEIRDLKFIENLPLTGFKGAMGIGLCKNIPSCKGGHYTVTMNVYAHLLEESGPVVYNGVHYDGFRVTRLVLDKITKDGYREIDLPLIPGFGKQLVDAL